jgi:hypothetical protein
MRDFNPYASSFTRGPLFLVLLFGTFWYPPTPGLWSMVAKLVLVGTAAGLLIYYASGAGPYGRLKRLRRDLPWFAMRPVTCHSLAGETDLQARLARHGYTAVELDGATIRSRDDLATALQAAFGVMRFPSDPTAKCSSILMRAAGEKPRRRVLIWRHAEQSLRHDPAMVVDVLATWSSMAPTLPLGLLVFVDLPVTAVAAGPAMDAGSLRIGERADEVDSAALASAPNDSWWKPNPGEMVP